MGSIIKLKNVSKFYYSKGVIASGFTKINLDFKIGEFVAITGESGSGKSTLLNVISGLDSYEEGELYINGEETSHYTEKDFEDYRRKYIGNIFQNFNLVNSYTVYQNIELVLLLNGNKKKDIKKQVLDLIRTVDLYRFRNTKVSKLSGGQKQRVAIARALAKETPIIIADEPTGNLDSRSANGIIKLLSEIAKDKLVIVVTHNYEQVEPYVTRKIKMHDGKVLEDKDIKDVETKTEIKLEEYKNITFLNKIRLGFRNTFNIIPKFILVLGVYLFITVALMSEYASFKQDEYEANKDGYNYYFNNLDDSRIIIKKEDKTSFTEEDYKKLDKISNIKEVFKNDLLLDTNVSVTDNNNFWISGNILNVNTIDSVDIGRLPSASNEIVLEGSKDDYYIAYESNTFIDKEMYIQNSNDSAVDSDSKIKIVGIKYGKNDAEYTLYLTEERMDYFKLQINQQYSNVEISFMNKYYRSTLGSQDFRVVPNNAVPQGYAYLSENYNYLCPNEKCINQGIYIVAKNLYYEDVKNLTVLKSYNKNNYNSILGLNKDDYDANNGAIYINTTDYNNLFNKDNYQSSIFVKDIKKIDKTIDELKDNGFYTVAMKDVIVNYSFTQALQIFKTIVTAFLVIVLFFISYFVIRIILKSRNVYFSTIRMLGATKNISKQLLVIELLLDSNLAYISFMILLYLNYIKIFNVKFMTTITSYLELKDYILLYIILVLMSYLVSQKFAKKLFKNSAVKTLTEEV